MWGYRGREGIRKPRPAIAQSTDRPAVIVSRCCAYAGNQPAHHRDIHMDKDPIPLALTADDLEAVDAALMSLETRLQALISLRPDIHRGLARMGEKSETFCRQTLATMAVQPQSVSPEFDLAGAQASLAAADALHPRLLRLRRLAEHAEDTELALGCDVMVAALQGHALLAATACDIREPMELQRARDAGATFSGVCVRDLRA